MFLLWGKYVRKYYLRYLLFFLLAIASLVAVDIFQLRIPELLGNIVTKLNTDGTIDLSGKFFTDTLIEVLIIAAVIFVGRILWRIGLFYPSKKIEEHLRREMFVKAEQLDVDYYHSNKVGNILSWATNDIETLEEFLGWGTLMIIDGTFLTVLGLVKMFVLNWSLALISFIPVLLIAVIGFICDKHMSMRWKLRQESNDSLYDFTQESFTGVRVVKAFVKEIQQIHEFSKIAKVNQEVNVKFTRISVLFDVLINSVIALVTSLIIGFGGWFVYATVIGQPVNIFGQSIVLTPGLLVTFSGYFASLVWPMIALGGVVPMFSKARTSYRRVANFLDLPINIKDKEGVVDVDAKGDIKFDHFSFSYPNASQESLSDISLEIKKGEMVGIIGAVGSGKTTLVQSLLHLYNINEKQVYVDGVDVMDISLSSLRNSFAYSPQDNFLFSGSIKENIIFEQESFEDTKFENAITNSDLKKDLEEFEVKEDTIIAENGTTVSGGQRQRISLARALYKDSPILILDDVVSAVDLKTEKNILKALRKERKDKTTLIVASRVSTVMNLDKVIVLNKGRLEAFDTPENLLKISETFSRMVMLQKLATKEGGKYE